VKAPTARIARVVHPRPVCRERLNLHEFVHRLHSGVRKPLRRGRQNRSGPDVSPPIRPRGRVDRRKRAAGIERPNTVNLSATAPSPRSAMTLSTAPLSIRRGKRPGGSMGGAMKWAPKFLTHSAIESERFRESITYLNEACWVGSW
jgi:hypothetical protein